MNTYTKWEYKNVSTNFADLNGLGGEGWELCAIHGVYPHSYYIFKRPKIEQKSGQLSENIKKAVEILKSTEKAKEKLGINFKVGDWVTQLGWKTAFLVSKVTDDSIYFWSNGKEIRYTYWDNFSLAPKDMPKDESSYNPNDKKIGVGDWVIHKNRGWEWSYEIAKIKNDEAFLWVDKFILKRPYSMANLIICNDFEKYPKHEGKPVKEVNPNNPNNIRKGDWVAICKDASGSRTYGAYKVHSVKNGKLVIIYEGKPFLSWEDNLKTVYKVKKEDMKFYKKIL